MPRAAIKTNSNRSTRVARRPNQTILRPTHALSASRLPSNQEFLLRYAPQITMNPSSVGSNALYQFRANDLYDPDFTSTGNQPRGFDQLMAYFNHFTVVGSRFRVHCSQPTLTSTGNQFCAVALTGASGDFTTVTTLGEVIEAVAPESRDWGFVGTANNSKSICFTSKWIKFDAQKFFGKPLNVLYSDFQGSASSSPAELAFFNILVGAWDRTSDTDTVHLQVEVEYMARFSEPKLLPGS